MPNTKKQPPRRIPQGGGFLLIAGETYQSTKEVDSTSLLAKSVVIDAKHGEGL